MTRSATRILAPALIGLLAALALFSSAGAGGWSVVVLDSGGVEGASADTPFTVGFTVLQHGKSPISDLSPRITARGPGGETVSFQARAEGAPGHYVATLTLPAPGAWSWQIDAFGPPAVMAPIAVAAPAPAPVAADPAPAIFPVALPLAALALAALTLVALLARRARRPAAA